MMKRYILPLLSVALFAGLGWATGLDLKTPSAASTVNTTLTPGPAKVGGAGISTDGGVAITLSDGSGGVTLTASTAGANDTLVVSGGLITANGSGVGDLTCRGDFYAGLGARFSVGYSSGDVNTDGILHTTSTKTRGVIVLTAGTGTVTVNAGAVCVCSSQTANPARCPDVSGTILTCNGTGTDRCSYVCI